MSNNKLPLRNWGKSACNINKGLKLTKKATKPKKGLTKLAKQSSENIKLVKFKIKQASEKIPKKSVYKKYGYF